MWCGVVWCGVCVWLDPVCYIVIIIFMMSYLYVATGIEVGEY